MGACVHPCTETERREREREKGKKLLFITVSVANSGIKSEMCHNHHILRNLLCILM